MKVIPVLRYVQLTIIMKQFLKELFTEYTTTRLVNIRSPLIAIVNIVLLVMVWCSFLGGIQFDIRKLYQVPCPVTGIILSKVKGYVSTEDLTDAELAVDRPELYKRVWDPTDLIFPSHGGEGEAGSFLIVTNLIITPNQTRSLCEELPDSSPKSNCREDSDCTRGYWAHSTHGVFTGLCNKTTHTCQIKAWCPVESEVLPRKGEKALLEDVRNFTLMLKNTVEFPGCGHKTGRLIKSDVTKSFIKNCSWHPVNEPNCPVFKIGDIAKYVGDDFDEVAIRGAVYRVKVLWDCDFDFGKTPADCQPNFNFFRVDDKNAQHSKGWNFRAATYFGDNRRTMRKYFAIKILIDLEGEGKEFNFFQFGTNLGATIGFFSVAPLVCDFLLDVFNFFGKWITKTTGKDCSIFHDVASRYLDDEAIKKLKAKIAASKEALKNRSSVSDVERKKVKTSNLTESSLQESSFSDPDDTSDDVQPFAITFEPFKAIEYY